MLGIEFGSRDTSLATRRSRVLASVGKRIFLVAANGIWGTLIDRPSPFAWVPVSDRTREERSSIGVFRCGQNLSDRACFHHLSAVHHDDAVTSLRDNADIVGDKKDSNAVFVSQGAKSPEDPCLRRRIQCCRRFVGDQ